MDWRSNPYDTPFCGRCGGSCECDRYDPERDARDLEDDRPRGWDEPEDERLESAIFTKTPLGH